MEYRITKETLGNDWLYSTLIALNRCMAQHGLPLYVVGACARDLAMKLLGENASKRHTTDLDVAIAIEDWQGFENLCKTLKDNHFKQYGRTHKFFYKGENEELDYEVDVVPFGGIAVDEEIRWPPEGNPVMSVRCFQDVMSEAVTVKIGDEVEVRMASLCGQFLIKLDTWNDRKDSTDKDAEDMLFILKKYFDAQIQQDIAQPDVVAVDDESLDATIWGAQWLAYDISQLLTTEHLRFYTELIREELGQEEKSKLIYHFMKYYGNDVLDDIGCYYDPCRQIWSVFEEIFSNELAERERR